MLKDNKIGIAMVTIGALIIVALLGVLIFVKPELQPHTPSTFKGPTSAPYVNGPKELPPQE